MKTKNVVEGMFTYRLHVLKKQIDKRMNDTFVASLSLTVTEARLLLTAGSFGPMSVSDLGRLANLDRSQASRATDILGRRGLVTKSSNEADARGVVVTLTTQGKAQFRRAAAISSAANESILSALDTAERRAFLAALAKLAHNVHADSTGEA